MHGSMYLLGSYFWSKVEVSPIRDQLSHHVIFLIVSHRDITVSKMHKRCPSTISMSSYRLVWDQSDNSLPRQPTLHGPDGVVMTPDSVILNELLDKEQRHTVKEKFMNVSVAAHRSTMSMVTSLCFFRRSPCIEKYYRNTETRFLIEVALLYCTIV